MNTLLIGYGNPGRQDDGLGPALLERLQDAFDVPSSISLLDKYQLTVEDALVLNDFDRVIFVDAATHLSSPFHFYKTEASEHDSFGSHSLSPEGVLQLSKTLYQCEPEAYVLAIQGIHFDQFEERLSTQGEAHLTLAVDFISDWLNMKSTMKNTLKNNEQHKIEKDVDESDA